MKTIIAITLMSASVLAQDHGKNTGKPTPEPDGLLVVHSTQNRQTKEWIDREVLRICAVVKIDKRGPKGEVIEYMAIAASKECPRGSIRH